ncbi:hypothetical protein N9M78_06330, partial [Alphaproteobacteria bacterium]|nr:hypothetical protein [Alphaproteobacteria bacterium]
MADVTTKISFTDDFAELAEINSFSAVDWPEKYGDKIAELVEAASGTDNTFVAKLTSLGLNPDQLFGGELSTLISSEVYSSELASRISAAGNGTAELTRLETNEIKFTAGDFSFSIFGENFSADLLQVITSLNSGVGVEQALIDQISGQISSVALSDTSAGVQASFNLSNLDINSKTAEVLSIDIAGVQLELLGSFPRDLSSIHNWLKSGLDIDALVAQEGSHITGFNLNTPTGRKIQLNDTGLTISVPYQGDSNSDGVAEDFLLEAQILGTHIGSRGMPEWSQFINGISVSDMTSDRTVLHQLQASFSDDKWELSLDELKVVFEGSFSGLNSVAHLQAGGSMSTANIDNVTQSINDNVIFTSSMTSSTQSDGSVIIGVDFVYDFSAVQEGVVEVFDLNVIGTSFADTLMSEIGSVYLSGGDGDDRLGFISPFKGFHEEASVLVGGSGADKFYISVSPDMPPITIHDFNPAEGDTIELSPSYSIYDGFKGYTIEGGALNFEFIQNTPTAEINLPSTNTYETGLQGREYNAFDPVKLSEVGYRTPDNPDNFIQIPQTMVRD